MTKKKHNLVRNNLVGFFFFTFIVEQGLAWLLLTIVYRFFSKIKH